MKHSGMGLVAALVAVLMAAAPSWAEAPAAAERLQDRLRSVHSLRAEFTQTREIGLTGEMLESPGVLAFQTPHAFHLTYLDEDRQEVVVAGDSLWVFMPLEEQAILYPFDPHAPGSEVFWLFGGRGQDLGEVFTFTQEPWEGHADALRLAPRKEDPGYPFEDMRLVVDAAGYPSVFYYAEATGDVVTMRFTRVEGNPPGIRSLLAFELPEGVEVLDAREIDADLR